MTYFAVKYDTFSDFEGPLNIIQIIWTFLCNILWPSGNALAGGTCNLRKIFISLCNGTPYNTSLGAWVFFSQKKQNESHFRMVVKPGTRPHLMQNILLLISFFLQWGRGSIVPEWLLTFRLPSYLLWRRLPRGVLTTPLDLALRSRYYILWYSHWFSIVCCVKWCIWI